MDKIYFVTGNDHKFAEVSSIIPNLEQLALDLPEIQSLDVREIAAYKLEAAAKEVEGVIMVEDTSLSLDCLNGLPGPLIKWFLQSIGISELYQMADKLAEYGAEAKDVFGIRDQHGQLHFIEGKVRGKLVAPRGDRGFGWDPIFQPDGYEQTFAQMSMEEKNQISHRGRAIEKLAKFFQRFEG